MCFFFVTDCLLNSAINWISHFFSFFCDRRIWTPDDGRGSQKNKFSLHRPRSLSLSETNEKNVLVWKHPTKLTETIIKKNVDILNKFQVTTCCEKSKRDEKKKETDQRFRNSIADKSDSPDNKPTDIERHDQLEEEKEGKKGVRETLREPSKKFAQ